MSAVALQEGGRKDYSPRELEKMLEFIDTSGGISRPQKPLQVLAERVMLASFGWPSDNITSAAYKRARAALLALEAAGKIECDYSPGKRLLAVRRKKENPAIELGARQTPGQESESQNTLPPLDKLTAGDRAAAATRRMLAQLKPRGWAAHEADITRRGDRNENWAHISFLKLIEVLTREFPGIVLDGRCDRSGRHNPDKGRIDLQDHCGQDFAFRLTTRHPNGPIIKGYIIYDSKGSGRDVEEFNESIFYKPGQSGCLLKRAIWANSRLSSRKEFAREVVSDCIDVGLLPKTFDTRALLNFFED